MLKINNGDLIEFVDSGYYFYSPYQNTVHIFGEIVRCNEIGIYINKINASDIEPFNLTTSRILKEYIHCYRKVLISGKIFFAHQNCLKKYEAL